MLKRVLQPSDGIEAVVSLKDYNDIKYEFLVFKIDENDQYIFNTSSAKMKFVSEMNCNCDHFLHDEYCLFGGNHKRIWDYVTLKTSFYHPLVQNIVVQA